MTFARDAFDNLPALPTWVTSGRAETPVDVAFLSGAAIAHLHLVLNRGDVPQTLLRARLALRAAEACVTQQGRPERAEELRDAAAFLQPGDSPGPAGETYLSWHRAVARPVSVKALHRALPDLEPDQIATWLDGCDPRGAGQGGPIARVAAVLEAVRAERPRDPAMALILVDAAFAQALGWRHALPLVGIGMARGDVRLVGEDLHGGVCRAVVSAATEVAQMARDLTRRAAGLRAVAPKLRAKGAEAALELFLTRDALAPSALTSLRSDRAARRFCDRLVDLGAVRELTGRDTFRLYGL